MWYFKSLEPVLIPISFNFGVAANTTEPCLLVSATTANFVSKGSNPFHTRNTRKSFSDQYIIHLYPLIDYSHT